MLKCNFCFRVFVLKTVIHPTSPLISASFKKKTLNRNVNRCNIMCWLELGDTIRPDIRYRYSIHTAQKYQSIKSMESIEGT